MCDNFLVRPHRRQVEQYGAADAWRALRHEQAEDIRAHLAGLPSAVRNDDLDAKRFDLLILRRQVAQLEGDLLAAERVREQVPAVIGSLLRRSAIPSVAEQFVLIEQVAGDEWWVDVTLPMLEVARLRLRGLVRFADEAHRIAVYTDFLDELGDPREVMLPGTATGVDLERFRAKATAFLRAHDDAIVLQRVRRNRQLTPGDLEALEVMLVDSGAGSRAELDLAVEEARGLGPFIRSLVGLDRESAVEAFGRFLLKRRSPRTRSDSST